MKINRLVFLKRIIALIISVALVLTALSACKSKNDNNDSSSETVSIDSVQIKGESASETQASSSQISQGQVTVKEEIPVNDDWKNHVQDYKLVALTFDDAPESSEYGNNTMSRIIDAVKKYNGAGTLFVNGDRIEKRGTALLKYAIDNGFELGNHTYTHALLTGLSKEEIKNEITSLNTLVKDKLGVEMKFMRPGNGAVNEFVFEVTQELKMPVVMGNRYASPLDYQRGIDSDTVLQTVVNAAYDGQIILLHCWSNATGGVIDEICKQLYNKGYRFVTLSELFAYKNIMNIPFDKILYDTEVND